MHEGETLKRYLKGHDYAIGSVAIGLKMTRQNLSYHLRKEKLDQSFLQQLNEKLGISFATIIKNVGDVKQLEDQLRKKYGGNPTSTLPFYDLDFTSSNDFLKSLRKASETYFMDIPEFNDCISFRTLSDYMEPLIPAGSILLAKKENDWKKFMESGRIYGINTTNGRSFLKVVKKSSKSNHLLLHSQNPRYEDFELSKTNIKAVWLIKGWINKNF